MDPEAVADGIRGIQTLFPIFDYSAMLARVSDDAAICAAYRATDNNYARLQLFRIVKGDAGVGDVVQNYVNKTFHIENEYVMQLNPHKYDFVPEYIIDVCDQFIA